jgi:hypothetical protein
MGQDRLVGEVAKLDGKQIFYIFEVRQCWGGGRNKDKHVKQFQLSKCHSELLLTFQQ